MRRPALIVSVAALLALGACSSGSGGSGPSGTPTASVSTPAPSSTAPSSTASSSTPVPSSRMPASSSTPRTSTRPTRGAAPTPAPPRTSAVSGPGVVVLNPGHNGGNASHTAQINRLVPAGYGERKPCDTTGTNSNAGYTEHAFNWDVTQRVKRLLEARGIRVVLARSNDTGVGPCVDERAAVGNRANVLASVTIHADGAPSSGHGFHVNQASRRPDGATKKVADASVRLGKDLRAALAASSGLTPSNYIGTDGLYFRSDFAALNLARRPATFLELGNMRNAGDAKLQSSGAGRQRIAAAIAKGIIAFLR